MAQTTPLIETLKKMLKAHGKTYTDVAETLGLSEASVKRLFSEKSFSLKRLDQVCQMMKMEITDLVQLMNENNQQLEELSEEQEKEIAGDKLLLFVTLCVLNRWKYEEIISRYDISEPACIRILTRLDKLKIIELLPGNRVKLLVAPNFRWRASGPILGFFQKYVESEFFNSQFDAEDERLICINGMLSHSSNAVFQRKLERLVQEFNELSNDDAGLHIDDRHGNTVVLAIRRWEYGLFSALRRK